MVSDVTEIIQANELLQKAKDLLNQEKISFDENIKIGAMIETPRRHLYRPYPRRG